ncbi:MAG: PAS domain-containing protein [Acidobacteriota bacterium]
MPFDPMTGPVLIVDRDNRLLRANHAFYQTSDLDPASAASRPLVEIMHPDGHWESCEICYAGVNSGSAIQQGGVSNSALDQIQVRAHGIHSAQGESVGAALVIRDLTVVNRPQPEAARSN